MKTFMAATLVILTVAANTFAGPSRVSPNASASGLGINVPLVARLVGAGNTLYVTSLDVSNHTSSNVQVDFYFDGSNATTQAPIVITGSVTDDGLGDVGEGTLRAKSNAHFEDFFGALVTAGMLSQGTVDQGVIGSVLFVYNDLSKRGQASVTARFKNALGEGTVGVALRGHEMTTSEPQELVAVVRDSRGNTSGEAAIYPNMFINHTGVTPSGNGTSAPVSVEVSAVSNTTGQAVGVPITLTITSGHTTQVGSLLQTLQVPAGSDDTILVYARVTSGSAAIHGIISQVDEVTRDGSVFEMSRADF